MKGTETQGTATLWYLHQLTLFVPTLRFLHQYQLALFVPALHHTLFPLTIHSILNLIMEAVTQTTFANSVSTIFVQDARIMLTVRCSTSKDSTLSHVAVSTATTLAKSLVQCAVGVLSAKDGRELVLKQLLEDQNKVRKIYHPPYMLDLYYTTILHNWLCLTLL